MTLFMKEIWSFLKKLIASIDKHWDKFKDYFGSVVKPCRFSVLMLFAVLLFFWFAPQGQDVLRSLGESIRIDKIIFFYVALVWWAGNVWYWGRVMLHFNYNNASDREEERKEQRRQTRKFLPRILGLLAFFFCAASFFKASATYSEPGLTGVMWRLILLGFLCLILGFVFIRVASKRRYLSKKLSNQIKTRGFAQQSMFKRVIAGLDMDTTEGTYDVRYNQLKDLPPLTRAVLGSALVISAVLFLLFLFWQSATSWFGTATIILLAAASWTAAGSSVVYWATQKSFPVFTLLLLWAIVISPLNDNHLVRTLTEKSGPQAAALGKDKTSRCDFQNWLTQRQTQTVEHDFKAWLTDDGRLDRWNKAKGANGPHPVFVVAAEGGGIRAAYWTAAVLAELQSKNPEFADHVYAMSGVSGGSLGIALFAALVEQKRDRSKIKIDVENILGQDFLSPTIAYMLYPDLLQRIIPWPISAFDRGLALEKSWEEAWQKAIGNGNFGKPFHNLYWGTSSQGVQLSGSGGDGCDKKSMAIPRLFLNSTWVETGKRVIGSNLKIDDATFKDSVDFFDVVQAPVPLSTVVHNSARFTFVSPAGIVVTPDCKKWGHLVDGGYFENSGATTASEILTKMQKILDQDITLQGRIIPVVIMIINDPIVPAIDRCGEKIKGRDESCEARGFMNEVLSPPSALMNTRGARGSYARDVLKSLVMEENLGSNVKYRRYWNFFLTQDEGKKKPLPLGWVLSQAAKDNMHLQLVEILDKELKIEDPLILQDAL